MKEIEKIIVDVQYQLASVDDAMKAIEQHVIKARIEELRGIATSLLPHPRIAKRLKELKDKIK